MSLRTLTVPALAAVAFAIAACGGSGDTGGATANGSAAADTKPIQLSGGTTALRLNATTKRVLGLAGIKLDPIGDAARSNGRLVLPITRGKLQVRPLGGRIEHSGGLRFSVAGQHIDATNLVLDPASNTITAEVDGRRAPLLFIRDGRPREIPPGDRRLVIPGTISLVGGKGASRLSEDLGVDALKGGLTLGRVVVSAQP